MIHSIKSIFKDKEITTSKQFIININISAFI